MEDKKMKMTFPEYDKKCTKLSKIHDIKPGWYPDPDELRKFLADKDPEQQLEYMIWLDVKPGDPLDDASAEGRQFVRKWLRENLELCDHLNKK